MDEKGENPNFCNCTNSANVLDVERSNVAIERSHVQVQTRLRQRAAASNVRTLPMNVRTFEFRFVWAKAQGHQTFERAF